MIRKETLKKSKEDRVLSLEVTKEIVKKKQEEEKQAEEDEDVFKDMT